MNENANGVTMPLWVLVASGAGLLAIGAFVGAVVGEKASEAGAAPGREASRRTLKMREDDYARCRSDLKNASDNLKGLSQRVRELNNALHRERTNSAELAADAAEAARIRRR